MENMGYIEEYFHKEIEKITEFDVQNFIAQKIQENLTLDYKDFRKYDDPTDLSGHICSFANSMGGLLILGISEKDNFPVSITWGDLKGKSRESLENKLFSQIYPKINNMKIIPVYQTGSEIVGIFLVEVPQGENPPYMSGDKKYYKRLNFQKQPMEGYEVADFFGRRKRPLLSLIPDHFEFRDYSPTKGTVVRWDIKIKNIGKSVSKEQLVRVSIENARDVESRDHHFKELDRDGPKRIFQGFFAAPNTPPIYPHPTLENYLGSLMFTMPYFNQEKNSYQVKIGYEILSDTMPIVKGNFTLSNFSHDFPEKEFIVTDYNEAEVKDW
jgi:hypothetical protein